MSMTRSSEKINKSLILKITVIGPWHLQLEMSAFKSINVYVCCSSKRLFNNLSVISRWCLVVTGSSILTFIVLPHCGIKSQSTLGQGACLKSKCQLLCKVSFTNRRKILTKSMDCEMQVKGTMSRPVQLLYMQGFILADINAAEKCTLILDLTCQNC